MGSHAFATRCAIGAASAAAALALGTPAAAAPPTFSGPTPFASGDSPTAITAADLNADGRPDLATTDLSVNGVGGNQVLINGTAPGAGTPSFTGPTPFAALTIPFSIRAVDVDGDGRPDLVTTNSGEPGAGGVSILRNTTSAGATVPAFDGPTLFVGGESPRWVTSADINADGKPDLVVTNLAGAEPIAVLLNATTGTTPSFSGPTTFPAGAAPRVVTTADFNRDGRPDVVAANFNSTGTDGLSILLNRTGAGAGTAAFDGPTSFDTASTPHAVTAADFNGDGKSDVAAVEPGLGVGVLVNTTPIGARTPAFAGSVEFPGGASSRMLTSADVNGDGKPDIVTADEGADTLTVLTNTTEPGAELATFAGPASFASDFGPVGITAADFNGDGRLDLAAANSAAPSDTVLLNTTPPPLTAGPAALAFGTQALGTISAPKAVTLTNSTDATLPLDVRLSGTVDDMLISRDTCGDGVPANGSCAVAIRFAPSVAGARVATLRLDPAGPQSETISLTGTGGALPQGPPGSTGATGAPGSPGVPDAPAAPAAPPSRAAARASCKVAKPKQRSARKRVTCRVQRAAAGAAWHVTRAGRTRAKGTLRRGTATLRLRLAPGRYTLSIAGRRAASFRVRR